MIQPAHSNKIILGIDPGTSVMGYGVISCSKKSASLIKLDAIVLNKKTDHFARIKSIFEHTLEIIDTHLPDELAIESPFYGKNIQAMLKLGRAQGAAISAALMRSIPIFEYAPRKIKQSITGQGNSSKEKVANYLKGILKFEEMPDLLDATDGLAVAMCHYYQQSSIIKPGKDYKNWNDFISKNPGRIK